MKPGLRDGLSPTQRFIERRLRSLSDREQPLDLLIFGFWGRCISLGADGRYLCGTDAEPENAASTGIAFDSIISAVARAGASSTALIFDSRQTAENFSATTRDASVLRAESIATSSAFESAVWDVAETRRKRGLYAAPSIALLDCAASDSEPSSNIFIAPLLEAALRNLPTFAEWAESVVESLDPKNARVRTTYKQEGPAVRIISNSTEIVKSTDTNTYAAPSSFIAESELNDAESSMLDSDESDEDAFETLDPAELYRLGEQYFAGYESTYCDEDGIKAFKAFRLAAEAENANAQNRLGDCFYYGIGTDEDIDDAIYWYRRAADLGNDDAQYTLGDLYFEAYEIEDAVIQVYRLAQTDKYCYKILYNCYIQLQEEYAIKEYDNFFNNKYSTDNLWDADTLFGECCIILGDYYRINEFNKNGKPLLNGTAWQKNV